LGSFCIWRALALHNLSACACSKPVNYKEKLTQEKCVMV